MRINIHSFSNHNSIRLIRSGNDYFTELEQLITNAQFSIHLQVYIFENDATGQSVLQKLKEAVLRGVSVFLVIDAYASPSFTPQLIKQLQNDGLYVKPFAPLHISKFKIGRRLHHKIVLIDSKIGLVGGINIADKYKGVNDHPWLDVAVYVSGPACKDLQKICLGLWPSKVRKMMPNTYSSTFSNDDIRLRVIQNDWWRKRIEISGAYNAAFSRAKQNITIVASYFLPGFSKRRLLIKASKRGVNIVLVTGGFSDVPLLKPAVEYLYKTLLQSGVRIYEWNKSVLHAKFATVDGIWTTVGSHNLNALSDYGSLEANIECMDEAFATKTQEEIDCIITEGCTEVNAEIFIKNTSWHKQAYRWICYRLVRFSLALLFVLMRKDR